MIRATFIAVPDVGHLKLSGQMLTENHTPALPLSRVASLAPHHYCHLVLIPMCANKACKCIGKLGLCAERTLTA